VAQELTTLFGKYARSLASIRMDADDQAATAEWLMRWAPDRGPVSGRKTRFRPAINAFAVAVLIWAISDA
jgi:hypothetical protein